MNKMNRRMLLVSLGGATLSSCRRPEPAPWTDDIIESVYGESVRRHASRAMRDLESLDGGMRDRGYKVRGIGDTDVYKTAVAVFKFLHAQRFLSIDGHVDMEIRRYYPEPNPQSTGWNLQLELSVPFDSADGYDPSYDLILQPDEGRNCQGAEVKQRYYSLRRCFGKRRVEDLLRQALANR